MEYLEAGVDKLQCLRHELITIDRAPSDKWNIPSSAACNESIAIDRQRSNSCETILDRCDYTREPLDNGASSRHLEVGNKFSMNLLGD